MGLTGLILFTILACFIVLSYGIIFIREDIEEIKRNNREEAMKELSIEEKAKRYDEAIEIAKSKIKNDKDHVLYEDDVIEIFPELKESEDERIRKEISTYLKSVVANKGYRDSIIESWIAWLEKQGEHERFRRAIQVGDQVTKNEDGVLVNLSQLKRVAKPRQKPADKEERVEEYGIKPNIKDK